MSTGEPIESMTSDEIMKQIFRPGSSAGAIQASCESVLDMKVKNLEQHITQLKLIIDRQSEVIKSYERLHEERKQAS